MFVYLFSYVLISCGLDVYYVLYAPYITYNIPTYATTDYAEKYFCFQTYEEGSNAEYCNGSSDLEMDGTAVYYKIYNNYSTMLSRNSAISTVNTLSNYSAAATKVTETYGYQRLGTSTGSYYPLIAASGSNTTVYIRLTNYSDDYPAEIRTGSEATSPGGGTFFSYPRRYGSSDTFDFGGDGKYDVVPKDGDDDVEYGTASTSGTWYVDMYAVSVAHDTTYATTYSLVLHLGAIPIIEGDDN